MGGKFQSVGEDYPAADSEAIWSGPGGELIAGRRRRPLPDTGRRVKGRIQADGLVIIFRAYRAKNDPQRYLVIQCGQARPEDPEGSEADGIGILAVYAKGGEKESTVEGGHAEGADSVTITFGPGGTVG